MTTFVDILSIPEVMKTYATISRSIAIAIIPIFFVLGILKEQSKLVDNKKPEFSSHIYITILVFIGLILYNWIFLKMISFCEATAMSLFSLDDWLEFQGTLSAVSGQLSGSIMTLSVVKLMAKGFYVLSSIAEMIFNLFRYALLSCLYVIGPIAFALAVFPLTRKMVKGWFINVFQIAFWIITLRILQAAMLLLGFNTIIEDGRIIDILIMSLVLTGLIIMTPVLTGKLLSAQNIGTMASAAMATTTLMASRITGTGKKVKGVGVSTKNIIANTAMNIRNAIPKVGGIRKKLIEKGVKKKTPKKR